MRDLVFCLCAALAAGPVSAACLTAGNSEGGVRIGFENGDVTTVQAMGADMFQVEETFSEGSQQYRYHALHSTYNLWYAPLVNGVQQDTDSTRVEWGVDLPTLPLPSETAAPWIGNVTEYDAQGGVIDRGPRQIRFAAGKPIILGGCRYETVTVGVRTEWTISPRVQLQFWSYLPEIGISFIVGWSANADEFVETTVTSMDAL